MRIRRPLYEIRRSQTTDPDRPVHRHPVYLLRRQTQLPGEDAVHHPLGQQPRQGPIDQGVLDHGVAGLRLVDGQRHEHHGAQPFRLQSLAAALDEIVVDPTLANFPVGTSILSIDIKPGFKLSLVETQQPLIAYGRRLMKSSGCVRKAAYSRLLADHCHKRP